MTRFDRIPRGRKGFAMLLLAVAAASVCTVTVSTSSSGTGYQLTAVKQMMRTEQSRWMLESFNELGLARQCQPYTDTLPEPQLFAQPYRFKPYQMGYSSGSNASTVSPERIAVTFSSSYAMNVTPYSQDVQIRMFSDPGLTRPTVELELNMRNVTFQTTETGQVREAVKHTQRRTAWKSREGNALP